MVRNDEDLGFALGIFVMVWVAVLAIGIAAL